MPLEQITGGEDVVGNPGLEPTTAGEPLWLDQRGRAVASHIQQTMRALPLGPGQTVEALREGHRNQQTFLQLFVRL